MNPEDNILRMIQQLGVMIRRILNKDISQERTESELEDLTGEWIGLPADLLLPLSENELYDLFVESDRMLVEKSYLMAEIYRIKGNGCEEGEARSEYFRKALFFYDKCSGVADDEIQAEINQRVMEITGALGSSSEALAGDEIERNGQADTFKAIYSERSPLKSASKRKKRNAALFWYALAVCLVVSLGYMLLEQKEVELVEVEWGFEGSTAHVDFRIVNHTNEIRLVGVSLSASRYSNDPFGTGYTSLGGVEKEYEIEMNSSVNISESFRYQGNGSGANEMVTVELKSNRAIGH